MAEEYPHVKFHGCNFVPTRHPFRENVLLEVYNLNEGLRGDDASFDMIHAYGCFKMVSNRISAGVLLFDALKRSLRHQTSKPGLWK